VQFPNPLHFYCLALDYLVLQDLDAKGLRNNWPGVTHCPIMKKDVQALKDVNSHILNIFLNKGLVKIEEEETIED
jgi:hypothetical protein